MEKKYIATAFCAPTGEWKGKYPNRLTDEVFQTLKSVGVNRIIAFGLDDRAETREATLKMCEKYDIGYLACVRASGEYIRVIPDKDKKPWFALTQAEKDALDATFIQQVKEVLALSPMVKGIFFEDECGYMAFEGEAHAKKVFDEHFKGYEFHNNFVSYSIDEKIFWGGMAFDGQTDKANQIKKPFELTGDLEISFKNRFRFYDKFVEGLLSKAHFEFISQDRYPFEEIWKEVPTSVHRALFDLNAFMQVKSQKYGNQFQNYMQVGNWSNGRSREMSYGEMALQMNVTMAYGGSGFGWFPAVFPLDWAEFDEKITRGGAGFIDLYGRPTVYAEMAKEVNDFYQPFLTDLLESKFVGITAYGEYDNGFDKEEAKRLPDGECIYTGELPELCQYKDERIAVDSSNQVSLSIFEKEGKRRYFIVNLSSTYANEVHLQLPKGEYVVYAMEETWESAEKISAMLKAGCATYIQEK